MKDIPHTPRLFCIGMNYIQHIREMGTAMPEKPVVFMKPASSLLAVGESILFPEHGRELHHEVELVARIGNEGRAETEEEGFSFVEAVTLGLDLTLRDVQKNLREKGLPWEEAKAFDGSAPVGDFTPCGGSLDLNNVTFRCDVNGEVRQEGNTEDMLFSVGKVVVELSRVWILRPGDLIFTGTPSGVGPLVIGDVVTIESDSIGSFTWSVVQSN